MKTSLPVPAPKASAAPQRAARARLPASVHAGLRSPGRPLDAATRAFMEPRFGHNFGNVCVHTGPQAAAAARSVKALAYTVGQDVVFGANEFAPHSARGRELLGHELAHTIQQRHANGAPPSAAASGAIELSASAAGRDIAKGETVGGDLPACGIGLSCAPTNMHLEDDEDRARQRRAARKPVVTAPKKTVKARQPDAPKAPIADTLENRAAARAELLAVIARMDQEEKADAAEAQAAEAERQKPVSYLPTTLSSLKPDPGLGSLYSPDEVMVDLQKQAEKTEADTKARAQQKEDEERPIRLTALRERLRHGYAKSVLADMLGTLPMRDLQILKKHGLEWPHWYTKAETFQHSVIDAIDSWASSTEANRPEAADYKGVLKSERDYFEVNYQNAQYYAHKTEALVNSGPASLVGRVAGTIIGGERGGDIGAAIGGGFDMALPVAAAIKGGNGQGMEPYSGETSSPSALRREPPEPTNKAEVQPDRPATSAGAPRSVALDKTQPSWALEKTEPGIARNPTEPALAFERTEPGVAFNKTEPGVPSSAPRAPASAVSENGSVNSVVSAHAEAATPAQVRAAYQANPFSVQKSGSEMWHDYNWKQNGGQGPAPIAFRTAGGMIRVDETRWLAVGNLAEINTAADLAPSPAPRPIGNRPAIDPLAKTGAPVDVRAKTQAPEPVPPGRQTQFTAPPQPVASAAAPRGYTPVPESIAIEAYQLNPYVISPSYSTAFHQSVWKFNGGQGPAPLAYRVGDLIRVDVANWPVMTRALIGQ